MSFAASGGQTSNRSNARSRSATSSTRNARPATTRSFRLLGPARDIIDQTPKLGECLFPYNSESVTAAFERVRDRIAETSMPGIKDLRFHDLRHTGITMLFWRGLRIEEVAIVSGHTNWAQLKRYTHIKPEELHRHFPTPQELKQVEKDVVR
ncbi:MAG: tyrosine-type recombinase/integrase, partial [Burkholderiales bacterium]|nr:tyrosine-type recombinase/integrase [Burkholderiales bacterium]